MSAPITIGNKSVTFYDPQEEERKRRAAAAKARGWDDATIAKFQLIDKIQAQQQQQALAKQSAQDAQQNQPQPKQASGLKKFLVNAAALAAHIGTGIGAVALAPETGGLSLAGGAGAGAGIDALKRKLLGEKQDVKSSLISGGIDVLPGVGELKNIGRGAQIAGEAAQGARAADVVAEGAKAASTASTGKSILTTVQDAFKGNPTGLVSKRVNDVGTRLRANVVNPQVPAGIGGAAKEAAIVSDVNKLVPGLTATSKYRNLQPAVNKISAQITPILDASTETVAKKTLINNIKTAARQSDNFIAGDATHEKALNTFLNDLTAKSKTADLTAKDLFEYKQGLKVNSAFDKLAKGANLTPNEAAKLSIWQNIDSEITRLAPEVKPLTLQQSNLIKAASGLDKAGSKTAGIPVLGVKSKAAAGTIQGGEELAGRAIQKAARIASTPVVRYGAEQSIAKGLALPGTTPTQPEQQKLPDVPTDLFPNAQTPEEQAGNALQQAGITDPQDMFDALSGTGKFAPQTPDQSTDQAAPSQLAASSIDLFNQALQAPDAKTRTALMDAAKTAAQFEQSNRAYQLAASKQKDAGTKLSASAQARKDALTTALASLDSANVNLDSAGGAQGVKGELGKLPWAGKFIDPQGAAYHNTKIELATQLAKAITGGSRPAGSVIDKYMHSLPDINDTPEYAQAKIEKLRSELQTQAKAFGFTDLLDNAEADNGNNFDFNTINQLLLGNGQTNSYGF